MSYTLKHYSSFEVVLAEGDKLEGGSRVTANDITVAGDVYEKRLTVADDYTEVVLWSSGGITGFDFLWLETDQDIVVNLKGDAGTPAEVDLKVTSKTPLVLGSTDVENTDLPGAGAITMENIVEITAKRNVADEEGDAHVRLVLVT